MKKAFTLAETLIVFTIIGVLATIMLSSFNKINPDKKKTMFKKGYSVAERVIGELVNDETLYPYDENNIGFLNTISVPIPGGGGNTTADTKFCELFTTKVNILGAPQITKDKCTFSTSDGINWVINTTTTITSYPKTIIIDTNGDEGPNSTAVNDSQDQFTINYYADGRITVTNAKEIEFLKSQNLRK